MAPGALSKTCSGLRGPVTAAVSVAASALAAVFVRYRLVEAGDVAAGCLAYGDTGWHCQVRAAAILLFNSHAFGIAAIAIAALAFLRPHGLVLAAGLMLAAAGLVLYNTALSALAISLLILALGRRSGVRG